MTFRTFATLIGFYIMSISKHFSINKRQAIAVLKLYLTYFLVSEIWIFIIDGFTFGRDFLLMPLFVFFIYSPINTLFVVLIHKLNICKCIIYSNSARFLECIINLWLVSGGVRKFISILPIGKLKDFFPGFDNSGSVSVWYVTNEFKINIIFSIVITLILILIYDFVGRKFKFISKIKVRYILLTLVMVLSLSTLSNTTYFDDDDLMWVDSYIEGDTIRFVSNNGDTDTMIINDKRIYNSWFNVNPVREKGPAYKATAYINYTILHNKEKLSGELNIVKYEKDKPVFGRLKLDNLSLDIYNKKNRIKEYRIGKEQIDDCMMSDTNCYEGFFVWSKSKGLLQYQFGDGLIYTRIGN